MSGPNVRRPQIAFWLPKPMNVYSPLLRELARAGRVDLRVVYFGDGRRDLFDDGETGARKIWDASLLDGYPSVWTRDSALAGFRAASTQAAGGRFGIGVLAGTQHVFLRGVLMAAWLRQSRVLLRYDATLEERYGSFGRDIVRRVALRVLFSRLFRLGYTGRDTKRYLLHYGARESQLWQFPYVVDHDMIRRELAAAATDMELRRRSLGLPADAVVVLAAVKFNERESPLDLVEGFVRSRQPKLHLVLVGGGPLQEKVADRVREMGGGRVTLPGFLPYKDLLALYAVADIFVHPARTEVWGVSVNEAMVAGMAVVATDAVGSARELIQHEGNGLIYKAGDIAALGETLDRLASDSGLRRRLAAAGREAIERLAPSALARRLEALALQLDPKAVER